MDVFNQIELITKQKISAAEELTGGCIGHVYCLKLDNGQKIVAKINKNPNSYLQIEGWMLQYLARKSSLPVPDVIHNSPSLILMSYIDGNSQISGKAEEHAAEILANLHEITAPTFGLDKHTLIGGLPQPNSKTDSWLSFFREHRLLYMASEGLKKGLLSESIFNRLNKFCDHLDKWLDEPNQPSLIHGDVWTTNVLAKNDRIVGFVDPAIYYADPEIELAFTTLFGTFGEPFFNRYNEIRPIKDGFFELRREVYNLYPLLVHVRLFGGHYAQQVSSILSHLGY